MAISFDPIRPYLGLLKAGLVVAVLVGVFAKGCSYGTERTTEKHAELMAKKDQALRGAAASLRGAAQVLREVDAEAERLLKAQAEAKEREADAAAIAAQAQAELAKSAAEFKKALANARKNPECVAVLDTDLRAVCGL